MLPAGTISCPACNGLSGFDAWDKPCLKENMHFRNSCYRCSGAGYAPANSATCTACSGKGAIDAWNSPCYPWAVNKRSNCTSCSGTGRVITVAVSASGPPHYSPSASYGGYPGAPSVMPGYVPPSIVPGGCYAPPSYSPAPAPYSPPYTPPTPYSPPYSPPATPYIPPSMPYIPSSPYPSARVEALVSHPYHAHALRRDYNDNGWICDGRKQPGGCKGGITSAHQTRGVPRFRCASGCDYDLCDKCVCSYVAAPALLYHPWHPHALSISSRATRWTCDGRKQPGGCRRGITHAGQTAGLTRYRCDGCDFDLCDACFSVSGTSRGSTGLPVTVTHSWHVHPLTRHLADDGWSCNGKSQPGGCKRGITTFGQTTGVPRFRCITCDFDLCDQCVVNQYK